MLACWLFQPGSQITSFKYKQSLRRCKSRYQIWVIFFKSRCKLTGKIYQIISDNFELRIKTCSINPAYQSEAPAATSLPFIKCGGGTTAAAWTQEILSGNRGCTSAMWWATPVRKSRCLFTLSSCRLSSRPDLLPWTLSRQSWWCGQVSPVLSVLSSNRMNAWLWSHILTQWPWWQKLTKNKKNLAWLLLMPF